MSFIQEVTKSSLLSLMSSKKSASLINGVTGNDGSNASDKVVRGDWLLCFSSLSIRGSGVTGLFNVGLSSVETLPPCDTSESSEVTGSPSLMAGSSACAVTTAGSLSHPSASPTRGPSVTIRFSPVMEEMLGISVVRTLLGSSCVSA
ncbi:hypothetical protein GDO81_018898 [Engystomops pustulosus]|uniref:Uncharacterized protein n=1 Tax=Engystomops pustulosus TaxID=76066 RepID=A0AAV6YXQ0_ENGPU|nr:hypothetical protein GDO81_018898 [Engystomops pustulosus]